MTRCRVEAGSRVTLHFSLRLAQDRRLVDATEDGEPMTLVIGEGALVEGLERRLLGLRPGDKRRFEIPCAEAYGPARTDQVHTLPRAQFPPSVTPEPGLVVGFETPAGDEVPGVIRRVNGDEIEVDFCHPLAGHDVIFEVEILAVKPPA
jgi:FKBP-type peptidyl-prolyl cis-trans isomerase SlpA